MPPMKLKIGITLLFVLSAATAFSLPIGNPADPNLLNCSLLNQYCEIGCLNGLFGVRAGFYGDYVFNRYLEVDRSADSSDLQETKIYTNAGYLALTYCDLIDLFATVGASSFHIKTPSTAFRTRGLTPGEYFTIETETDFSWSVGLRAALLNWRCFTLGVEGQYFRACPSINFVREEDDEPLYLSSGDHFKYHEWQVGAALSREFYVCTPRLSFVPYIGVKWACAKVDMNNLVVINPNIQTDTYVLYDLENKKSWGYAVGITLALNDMISVMVERRFGDENGLQVNGQIHF